MTSNSRTPPGVGDAILRLAILGGCLLPSAAMAMASNIQIGTLACEAAQGSSTALICDFHREDGPPEAYAGILDAEFSGMTKVQWSVVSGLDGVQSGDLAGEYFAKGKAGLIGGHGRSFTLHPTDSDSNPAAGIEKLSLIASN